VSTEVNLVEFNFLQTMLKKFTEEAETLRSRPAWHKN